MPSDQIDHKEQTGLLGKRRPRLRCFLAVPLLFLFACDFIQDPSSAIATGVAQTQQVSELETAAAEASGVQPTQTLDQAQVIPPPSCEGAALPEGFVEQNGQFFLNDQPTVMASHVNEDGSTSMWISLADHLDWPLYLQKGDCTWVLGFEKWTARITIVNTNDVPLQVGVIEASEVVSEGSDSQDRELTPYEYFSFSNMPPGIYQFSFSFNAGESVDLSCMIEMLDRSHFIFVATPSGIAVAEESFEPQSAQDMDVSTSPLCGE